MSAFGKSLKAVAFEKIAISKELGGMVEENLTAMRLIVSFA
jgi:hypothetical protein